jgi:hypothetical protein
MLVDTSKFYKSTIPDLKGTKVNIRLCIAFFDMNGCLKFSVNTSGKICEDNVLQNPGRELSATPQE